MAAPTNSPLTQSQGRESTQRASLERCRASLDDTGVTMLKGYLRVELERLKPGGRPAILPMAELAAHSRKLTVLENALEALST